jgi:hypothetical protein
MIRFLLYEKRHSIVSADTQAVLLVSVDNRLWS